MWYAFAQRYFSEAGRCLAGAGGSTACPLMGLRRNTAGTSWVAITTAGFMSAHHLLVQSRESFGRAEPVRQYTDPFGRAPPTRPWQHGSADLLVIRQEGDSGTQNALGIAQLVPRTSH